MGIAGWRKDGVGGYMMTTLSEEESNKVQELPLVKGKDRAAGMYTMNLDFEGRAKVRTVGVGQSRAD